MPWRRRLSPSPSPAIPPPTIATSIVFRFIVRADCTFLSAHCSPRGGAGQYRARRRPTLTLKKMARRPRLSTRRSDGGAVLHGFRVDTIGANAGALELDAGIRSCLGQ